MDTATQLHKKTQWPLRIAAMLLFFFGGCSTFSLSNKPTVLTVDGNSTGREVISKVPTDYAVERFDMVGRDKLRYTYVALNTTPFGGLLFIDNKFYGTVTKRDARAFYSCRGYVSATQSYWAREAANWADALQAAATPASSVTLSFPAESRLQSAKEHASNPFISTIRSLVGIGSNPLNIVSRLDSAHDNLGDTEKHETTLAALKKLAPGDSEASLAKIVNPEDMSFTSDGIVMAYPSFMLDFYVSNGTVDVLQQPSFQRLSREHPEIFYVRNMRWGRCDPLHWRDAMPPDWTEPVNVPEKSKDNKPQEKQGFGLP